MRMLAVLLALGTAYAADDYTVSGTVVDHVTNQPLKHVLVEIIKVGRDGESASVLTEADGRFIFLHVPKGKYNLKAQRRGQNPEGFHSGTDGFATALVVDGRLKTEDIVFPLRSDASISGIVVGDDGEPVRNALVHLLHEAVFNGESGIFEQSSTNPTSAGRFHFGHLDAGKYYLAAAGTRWYDEMGAQSVYPVTFYGDTTDGNAARSIMLAEGAGANVQIEFHAVPAIHVKVTTARQGFQLVVRGPGGTGIPVSSTMMNVQNVAPAVLIEGQTETTTSGELTNIPAGRYEVTGFEQNGEQALPKFVDLTDGATMPLDAPVARESIGGKIIFDSPRPAGALGVFMNGGGQGAMAEVAEDGSFKFERGAAGTFDIHFNGPSLVMTSFQAKGARVVHDRLEVAPGASVEMTIHAQTSETLAKVEGFAIKGDAGVAGAMVLLLPQDLARVRLLRRDQSDADGSFSLKGVPPGRYTLIAIDEGSDLAYKNEQLIKPYLAGGLSITIPLKNHEPLKVPVQTRKP